jgi:hypothetical protein
MAFDLRSFLKSKDKYPDDHKVTLADGVEVTLGDLRAFDEERDGEVRSRAAELDTREGHLSNLANEVAALKASLDERLSSAGTTTSDPRVQKLLDIMSKATAGEKASIFDETPEYFKPLVAKLDEYAQSLAAQKQALDSQRSDVEKTITWHTRKQIERDYRSYKDWPENFDVKKAIMYAQQNRVVDEMGYPDFDRIHDAVTTPIRQKADLEAERKKIREEERAAVRKEAAAQPSRHDAFVPLPNSGGGAQGAGRKTYGGVDKISDADILSDPEILATFTQVQ